MTTVKRVSKRKSMTNASTEEPVLAVNQSSAESLIQKLTAIPTIPTEEHIEATRKAFSGLDPDVIDGAIELGDEKRLFLRIRWKNDPQPDLIYSKVANLLYPQLVIAFYQKHLMDRNLVVDTTDPVDKRERRHLSDLTNASARNELDEGMDSDGDEPITGSSDAC